MTSEMVQALLITNGDQDGNAMLQKLNDAGIKFNELKVEGEKFDDPTGTHMIPVLITREGDFEKEEIEKFIEIKRSQRN